MGAWGTGVFQDDFACDLRDYYNELVALKFDDAEIFARLRSEFGQVDGIDASTFWIALALLQHKLGRLTPDVRERACGCIDSGQALRDWAELTEPGDTSIRSRARQLAKAKEKILSPQPPRKTPKPPRELLDRIDRSYQRFDWKKDRLYALRAQRGEVLVFAASEVGTLKLPRHYARKGNRFVPVEPPELVAAHLLLMNFRGAAPPSPDEAAKLRPYVTPVSETDRREMLGAVDEIRANLERDAKRSLDEFHAGCREMHPGASKEQLRPRYLEYTEFCREQLARYTDRERAVDRYFYKRFSTDPRQPAPDARLIDLKTDLRIDCEDNCTAAAWDALEECLDLPGLGR